MESSNIANLEPLNMNGCILASCELKEPTTPIRWSIQEVNEKLGIGNQTILDYTLSELTSILEAGDHEKFPKGISLQGFVDSQLRVLH